MSLSHLQVFKSCFQSGHGIVTTEAAPSLGPKASFLPGKLYIEYKAFRDSLTDLTPEEINIINEIEMFNCLFYKKYFDMVAPENFFVTYTLMKIFKDRPEQMDWRNFEIISDLFNNIEYLKFVLILRLSGYVARECISRINDIFPLSEYISYARQDLIDDVERNLTQLEDNPTSKILEQVGKILNSGIWANLNSCQPDPILLKFHRCSKERVRVIVKNTNIDPNKILFPPEGTGVITIKSKKNPR